MSRGSSNKATECHFCRAVSPGLVLPQGRATSRRVQQRSHAHSLAVPQPHLDASTQQQELAPSCPTCRAFSPILLNVGSAGQASCFCRCRAGPGAAHRLLPRTLVIALNAPRGRCLLTLPSHLLALCAGAASSSGAPRELGTALQSGNPRGSVCLSVGQGGDGGARPGYAAICGSGAGPRPGQDACGVGREAAEQRAALRAELRWGRRSPSSSNPISALRAVPALKPPRGGPGPGGAPRAAAPAVRPGPAHAAGSAGGAAAARWRRRRRRTGPRGAGRERRRRERRSGAGGGGGGWAGGGGRERGAGRGAVGAVGAVGARPGAAGAGRGAARPGAAGGHGAGRGVPGGPGPHPSPRAASSRRRSPWEPPCCTRPSTPARNPCQVRGRAGPP